MAEPKSYYEATGLNPFENAQNISEPISGDLTIAKNALTGDNQGVGATPTWLLEQAQKLVPEGFSGSPDMGAMVSQSFLDELESARAAREKSVRSIYEPRIKETQETGVKKIGGLQEMSAQATLEHSLGFSSILQENIKQQEKDNSRAVDELTAEMERAITSGNEITRQEKQTEIKRVRDRIDKLAEMKLGLLEKGYALFQAQETQKTATEQWEKTFEQNKLQDAINSDINIANSLKTLLIGQTITIGGQTYTGLAKPTTDTQLVQNKDTGDATLIDTNTGDIIAQYIGVAGLPATPENVEAELVKGMIEDYPDAGIAIADTLAVATMKLNNSKIYKQKVRLSGGGGGSAGTKLTTQEEGLLAGYPTEFKTWWKNQTPEFRSKSTRQTIADEYERFKKNLPKPLVEKPVDLTNQEQEAGVWQWLASDEAINMTNAQKKQEIMSAGFNPEDFEIY